MIEAAESMGRSDAQIARELGISCRVCGATGESSAVLSNGKAELRKCRECGVVFLEPPIAEAELERYFADEYITWDERLEFNFGRRRDEVLALCAQEIRRRKDGGRILDVGCAGGHFLSCFFDAPAWQRYGVEPSGFAAEKAAAKNIEIYRGAVSSVRLPAGRFDVITVLDVLNYFEEPRRELQKLRRALKPDGLLVIETSLAGTRLFRHTTRLGRLAGGPAYCLLNEYLQYYFSKRSLNVLLRESGFQDARFLSLPGNLQPRALDNYLHNGYYAVSRLLSHVSRGRIIAGPNCLAIARVS